MEDFIIGVDGGGTKTHAVLIKNSQVIDSAFAGPANIRTSIDDAYTAIKYVIDKLLTKYNLLAANIRVGIGVAGFSVVEKREHLYKLLFRQYPKIKLISDGELACLASHQNHDGGIIICGTGVVSFYSKDRQTFQIGGWGFPHADLGGGAYLGFEACRLLCKAIDGVITWQPLLYAIYGQFSQDKNIYKNWLLLAKPNDFTQIATLMLNKYLDDPYTEQILKQGTVEIEQFIQAVILATDNLPLKFIGGLAPIYLRRLNHKFPNLQTNDTAPAVGAQYLFN